MDAIADLISKLRKFLRHRGRTGDEADELIQEAFLRLQAYRQERPVREPEAFLVRTVQNLTVDASRRRRTRGTHVDVEVEGVRLIDPGPAPDEVLTAQQRLRHLRAGLEALAPRTREVVLLQRIEGFSHAQIAARLGITVSAVEKHIAKAALFLADWMAGESE
jgi:RNA polymerase sigma factor (sigma-70 family)